MDMFEPQDHPDDIPYPGGAPRPPYDVTGYNIAYSMGIKFDRILDGFDGPFEKLPDVVTPAAGKVAQAPSGGGYLLSHQVNDAFVAVNRLLKANEEVYWLKSAATVNGKTYPVGTMYIPAKATTLPILQKVAADKGLTFDAVASAPSGNPMMRLKPVRIGLWDQYGGSMPSGWTRWLFEQYEFPFEVVFPNTLDAGNLNANTGDTRTGGLNVVDSIGSAVGSGNSSTMMDTSSPQPGGCGGATSTAPPVAGSGASAGVVGSDNAAVATGADVLVIGGDGVQDGGVTVSGDRNVVTYDDGNVAVGGTGDMNAQVGDSESGGTVVMEIRDSQVQAGDSLLVPPSAATQP
jgi:hypothetical protein